MPIPISSVGFTPAAILLPSPMPAVGGGGGQAFQSVLSAAVERVEQFRNNSEQAVERFLSGEDEDLHKVALATQRAELAFEMFVQVKNKVVQAYQEVMRMQL